MKTFLAIYIGSHASQGRDAWSKLSEAEQKTRAAAGMTAWGAWGAKYKDAILVDGAPLGKTKRVSNDGIADIKNTMTGYTLVQAESHEAAARMFEGHPHFAIFPGDSVEIMECLPIPTLT